MPRGDGTGPNGLGSITGRGLGYCAGYNTPGYTKGPGMGLGRGWGRGRGLGYGRGLGWGRGFGRGRWGYSAPAYTPVAPAAPVYRPVGTTGLSQDDQLNMLKQEKEYLESEMNGIKSALEDISKRITDLESE